MERMGEVGGSRTSGRTSATQRPKESCTICGRELAATDVKFVLPSRAFGAQSLDISKRLACVECYSVIATKNRVRSPVAHKSGLLHRLAARRIAESMMQSSR